MIKTFIKKHQLYILVFFIYFLPRIIGLGSDIANIDTSHWYPRMDKFAKYIIRGEFNRTALTYHPGITLLWISTPFKYAFEKLFMLIFHYDPRFMPYQFIRLHFVTKLPLILVISLIGTLNYHLVKKTFSKRLAIIFTIMLSLEPFFLGVSRFLHISALTSMLSFTSLLFVITYYTSKLNSKWIYLSGIFVGLATLTKVSGIIVTPIIAIIIIWNEFVLHKHAKSIITIFKTGLKVLLPAIITFYVLYPAMWTSPIAVVTDIYHGGILDTAFSDRGAPSLTGSNYTYYLEILFFRSLPTTFILFLIGLNSIKQAKTDTKRNLVFIAMYLAILLVSLSTASKLKDRYIISAIPAFVFLAAYATQQIYNNKKYQKLLMLILGSAYIITIIRYHPVYSFYYTDFINGQSGMEKLHLPVVNRGEYYAQAAKYINTHDSLPEVRNVIIPNRSQMRTFPPFFYGESFTAPKLMPKDGYNADYIIAKQDTLSYIPQDLCHLEKEFGPRFGYTAIYLYSCQNLNNTYKSFGKKSHNN